MLPHWGDNRILPQVRKQVKLHAVELQAAPQDCSHTGRVGLGLSPQQTREQTRSRIWGKAAERRRRLTIGVRTLRSA